MTTTVLSVRVSDKERALLESAAEGARTTISDFVRRAAIEDAEEALMSRRIIEIPAEKWAEIEDLVNKPAEEIPAARELAEIASQWRR